MRRWTAPRTPDTNPGGNAGAGPVLLATFDVPFDPAAAQFAVRAALDANRALIVANVVELSPNGFNMRVRADILGYPRDMEASLLAPVESAVSLGVPVERLRVQSPHRVAALVELARERDAGLVVLGPDRRRVNRRLYLRAAKAIRDRLECLLWLPVDSAG
jgi:nucleotide-binding universal stress UspA family protein